MVDEGDIMTGVELQAPFVLAGYVGATLATVAVFDVVVNDAAIDQGALLFLLVGVAIPLAAGNIFATRQEVERLQGIEEGRGESQWRNLAGFARTRPCGRAGIAPPGEIRASVIGRG